MKIALYVTGDYYLPDKVPDIPSGIHVYTRSLARALVERGHEVTVLVHHWSWADENGDVVPANYEFEGSRVKVFPQRKSRWHCAEDVQAFLAGEPHDVFEAHQCLHISIVEQIVGTTPTVVRYASDFLDALAGGVCQFWRNDGYDGYRVSRQGEWALHQSEMFCIKNADLVLCAGQKQIVKSRQLGVTRTRELPLGIPAVDETVWGDHDRDHIFVSVSRLPDPRKGGEFIPGIVNSIPADIAVTVLAECDMPSRDRLLAKCNREFELLSTPVTDEALVELQRRAWATIVPTKSESFGLVLLEPFARGSIVFAWDQADPSKRHWPLWSMGSHLDPAKAFKRLPELVALAQDPRKGERERLRDFASAFLWDNLIPRYEEAYAQAIANSMLRGRTRG